LHAGPLQPCYATGHQPAPHSRVRHSAPMRACVCICLIIGKPRSTGEYHCITPTRCLTAMPSRHSAASRRRDTPPVDRGLSIIRQIQMQAFWHAVLNLNAEYRSWPVGSATSRQQLNIRHCLTFGAHVIPTLHPVGSGSGIWNTGNSGTSRLR